MDWILVETLGPDGPTVVAKGGRVAEWTSLRRIDAARGAAGARETADAVREVRESGTSVDRTYEIRRGARNRLLAHPVLSPDGTSVHGVELWLGDAAVSPPPRRTVASADLDYTTRVNRYSGAGARLQGESTPDDGPVVAGIPEFFRRLVKFDAEFDYVEFAVRAQPGERIQSTYTLERADGTLIELQHVTHNVLDGGTLKQRALVHDISDVKAPAPIPLSLRTIRAAHGSGSHWLALVDLAAMRIVAWQSDPIPELEYNEPTRDRFAVHPDDAAVLAAGRRKLLAGADDAACSFRARTTTGEWTGLDASARVITAPPLPILAVVQFHPQP